MAGTRPDPRPPVILQPIIMADPGEAAPRLLGEETGLERIPIPVVPGPAISLWSWMQDMVQAGRLELVLNLSDVANEPGLPAEVIHAMALSREMPWEGGRIHVCGVKADLEGVLKVQELDRRIKFYATETEAVEAARRGFIKRKTRFESLVDVEIREHQLALTPEVNIKKILRTVTAWDPKREVAVVRPDENGFFELEKCVKLLYGSGIDNVFVGLEEIPAVTGVDVARLQRVASEFKGRKGVFAVFNPTQDVLGFFKAAGILGEISVFPHREAALDAFKQKLLGVPVEKSDSPAPAAVHSVRPLTLISHGPEGFLFHRAANPEGDPEHLDIGWVRVSWEKLGTGEFKVEASPKMPMVIEIWNIPDDLNQPLSGAMSDLFQHFAREAPMAALANNSRLAMLLRLTAGKTVPVFTTLTEALQSVAGRALPDAQNIQVRMLKFSDPSPDDSVSLGTIDESVPVQDRSVDIEEDPENGNGDA